MPRNRNQPAVIVPLTLEQETTLGWFGNLLTGNPGESNLETLVRLFGSTEAAAAGWFDHRDVLMAEDPVAGRRPCGWWVLGHHREPPPTVEQAAILRELGELSEREEQQLGEWRTAAPEFPSDLGIDHVTTITIAPTVEDPHVDDAPPEPPRPTVTETAGGSDAPTEAPEVEGRGEEPERAPEDVVRPQILQPTPWYQQHGRPREIEGWETD